MLSLELEDFLINGKYHIVEFECVPDFDTWGDLRQQYLDNNMEKATLYSCMVCDNENAKFVGPCISIVYDGTDKDFIEKYIAYIKNWNNKRKKECMNEMMKTQGINEYIARDYAYAVDNIMKIKADPLGLEKLQKFLTFFNI